MRFSSMLAAFAVSAAVFTAPLTAPAATFPVNNGGSASSDAAANSYCAQVGGQVQSRYPAYGTNDPSNELVLSGHHNFCAFTAPSDGSRIYIFTDTLYTKKPTLAALAYYAQVPVGQCNGNPASCYCTLLGGTDLFGGINAAGGAWVYNGSTPDTNLETCIFPDLSSIDSWGLTYHSVGIIRGIDLSTIMRYANPYAKKRAKQVFGPHAA
jgi:hypothetical protein